MMMFQSKFVFDIFAGRDAGWKTQNRDDCATSFRLALERHFWHMTLGILTMVVVYFYAPELFWWMLPITIGLTLSVPISMLTSLESAGRWCRSHNFSLFRKRLTNRRLSSRLASIVPSWHRRKKRFTALRWLFATVL